jgi:hypothetical protein
MYSGLCLVVVVSEKDVGLTRARTMEHPTTTSLRKGWRMRRLRLTPAQPTRNLALPMRLHAERSKLRGTNVAQSIQIPLFAAAAALLVLSVLPLDASARTAKERRCLAAASDVLGRTVRPSEFNVITGTSGRDRFTATARRDLICGFRGRDMVRQEPGLQRGDVFIGGPGRDQVLGMWGGRFIGGDGADRAGGIRGGSFVGGEGDDTVFYMGGGVFRGGPGDDRVSDPRDPVGLERDGRFYGGRGEDFAWMGGARALFKGGPGADTAQIQSGTFHGGTGDDRVDILRGDDSTFDGGKDDDSVSEYEAGRLIRVESCTAALGYACP